jgi:hypothetical protein
MPDFTKKWNYDKIKIDFYNSEYTSISLYLKEKVGMSDEQVNGGQTRRKLGKFKIIDEAKKNKGLKKDIKSLLKNPEGYSLKLENMVKKGFLAKSSLATLKLFNNYFNIINNFDVGMQEGLINPIEALKQVPNLQLLGDIIQKAEIKVIESMGDEYQANMNLKFEGQEIDGELIEALRDYQDRKSRVNGRGAAGEVYQPQILLKTLTVQQDNKEDKEQPTS